jgi:hypothetical protein
MVSEPLLADRRTFKEGEYISSRLVSLFLEQLRPVASIADDIPSCGSGPPTLTCASLSRWSKPGALSTKRSSAGSKTAWHRRMRRPLAKTKNGGKSEN